MAVSYDQIVRESALRINAILGSTVNALETNYAVSPITAAQWNSATFTLQSTIDTCLLVEEKIASTIANTGNHPWRSFLSGATASLLNKAFLPAEDESLNPIIGIYGSVYDSTSGRVCTEQALETVNDVNQNPNSILKAEYYWYKIDGQRIYHTRPGVIIDVCTYNRTSRASAVAASLLTPILLPDVLEEAMCCGVVSMLFRDDEFTSQAGQYRAYFNQSLDAITQGLSSVPSKVQPGPSLQMAS